MKSVLGDLFGDLYNPFLIHDSIFGEFNVVNFEANYVETLFGAKLYDEGLADVWSFFFEKGLETFHFLALNYYRKDINEFVKDFATANEKDKEYLRDLVISLDHRITNIFRSSIEPDVLFLSSVGNGPLGMKDVIAFFQAAKPSETKFERAHAVIAEYLAAESRNPQGSMLKRFILGSYNPSMLTRVAILLIEEGYSKYELIEAFEKYNTNAYKPRNAMSEQQLCIRVAYALKEILDYERRLDPNLAPVKRKGRRRGRRNKAG
ncbi:hypothetical protein OXX80_008539 [Metschnikowia pulcherrima]